MIQGGDGASEAGEMSEASEAGEASGMSETIEARRCRSDAQGRQVHGGVSVSVSLRIILRRKVRLISSKF